MINCKLALLSLVVLISFVTTAAAEDWLGNELQISDIHHTAAYLSKTGGASENDTNVDGTDGGIAALPTAKADREVYNIGGTETTAQPPLADTANAAEPSDYSGRWSIAVAEETSRSLDLALYQRGDLVFGKGVMGTSDSSAAGAASSEDRGIGSMMTGWTSRLRAWTPRARPQPAGRSWGAI